MRINFLLLYYIVLYSVPLPALEVRGPSGEKLSVGGVKGTAKHCALVLHDHL